ncbi:hypothetical protein LZ30DRAFT_700304 [Colletotrichum cereale]|nr:hypothetical protein LZ30DRAFT_700304 [Colletotrichum cereale]
MASMQENQGPGAEGKRGGGEGGGGARIRTLIRLSIAPDARIASIHRAMLGSRLVDMGFPQPVYQILPFHLQSSLSLLFSLSLVLPRRHKVGTWERLSRPSPSPSHLGTPCAGSRCLGPPLCLPPTLPIRSPYQNTWFTYLGSEDCLSVDWHAITLQ